MRKGKEFIFPENVDKNYGVFKGLTLKEVAVILFSFIICSIVVFILPPRNIILILIKIPLIMIPVMFTVIYAIVGRPVKHRPNIKWLSHRRMKKQYDKRQHLFFVKGNEGDKNNANNK